ncbi:dual specificity protein phosphatase 22-B-like isoform X2 [Adelges cooleyi]|uniref:dual specificity protein phosphatase 22-B-like isoform X2 n=1 Tax=Adelges cooleyi TaxID=133065 RepID=UPI00217F70AC|nr:dual specificity protein phosphatase 22-B-like isoform X2 [Adelges cooleyi]
MIIPGLYIGSLRDSKDLTQLEKNQITHIISILDVPREIYQNKIYLCIEAIDSPEQNLMQYFSSCNDFIHKARLNDQNVLIHCLAGMSRSVTIAIAYVMSVTSIKLKYTMRLIKMCRPIASPNKGFSKQLKYFECYGLSEERTRLKSLGLSAYQLTTDEEYCIRKLKEEKKKQNKMNTINDL